MTHDGATERVREAMVDLVAPVGAPGMFTSDDVIRQGRAVRRRRRRTVAAAAAAVVAAVTAAGVLTLRPGPADDPAVTQTPVTPTAAASPSPSQVPSRSQASGAPAASGTRAPSASAYPDASNTGVPAGTTLTRHTGDLAIRQDGTVIDGWDLAGSLDIYANNVTIRNTRIASSNWWGINLRDGYTGLKVLHSTITGVPGKGPNHGAEDYGVKSAGGTVEVGFCDIARFAAALSVTAGSVHDNYLHAVQFFVGDGGRWQGTNGLHSGGGGSALTIRHNTVLNETPADRGATSALGLFADFGPVADVTVDDNVIGGGQYAFYGGGPGATRVRVTNNRFTTAIFPKGGFHGPVAAWNAAGAGNVWTGNVWADGPSAGRPVTP